MVVILSGTLKLTCFSWFMLVITTVLTLKDSHHNIGADAGRHCTDAIIAFEDGRIWPRAEEVRLETFFLCVCFVLINSFSICICVFLCVCACMYMYTCMPVEVRGQPEVSLAWHCLPYLFL